MSNAASLSFKRLAMLLSWFLRLCDDWHESWNAVGGGWRRLDPEWADRFIAEKLPEILHQDERQVKQFWEFNKDDPFLQEWLNDDQETKRLFAIVITLFQHLLHFAHDGGVAEAELDEYVKQVLSRLRHGPTKTWLKMTLDIIHVALRYPEAELNKIWSESMRDSKFRDN
jgi:hypothetical protein